MIRSLYIILFVGVATSLSFGQVQEIQPKYQSSFEESVLTSFFDGEEIDIIRLLLAVNPEADADVYQRVNKRLDKIVQRIDRKEIHEKDPIRAVKSIFFTLHRRNFSDFKEDAQFFEIFDGGDFNCVTATALLAWTFEKFGIEYSIKLTPTHVFVVALTDEGRVFLETTDPITGFIRDNKRSEYRLKKYHPLASEYVVSSVKGADKRKKKNETKNLFFNAEEISLVELAGVQYYNAGVNELEERDFEAAYHYFSIAEKLHNNNENRLAIRIALINHIRTLDFSSPDHLDYLTTLSATAEDAISKKTVLHGLHELSESMLLGADNEQAFTEAYFGLYSNAIDANLKSLLQGIFMYELGRYELGKGSHLKAIRLLERSISVLPNIQEIEDVYIDAVSLAGNYH